MKIMGKYYDNKTLVIGLLGGLALFCVPVIGQFLAKIVQSMRSGVKAMTKTTKTLMTEDDSATSVKNLLASTEK